MTDTAPHSSLAALPDALLFSILPLLDFRALLRVSRTCRELRQLGRDALIFDRADAGVRALQRFALCPPSLRHLRLLFSSRTAAAAMPTLDLTGMQPPPGAAELLPPSAFAGV